MSGLGCYSIVLGIVFGGLGVVSLVAPERFGSWIVAFPRNKYAGWALTAIGMVWAAKLLLDTPLGSFEGLKPWVYVVTPVAIFLIGRFMDELLAARALGGVLLLIPAPLLIASRAGESPARLIVVVIAYLMAIEGVALVLGPYQFRRWMALCVRTNTRCRICGAAWFCMGLVLLALAFAVR